MREVLREVHRRHAALPQLPLNAVAVGEGGGESIKGIVHAVGRLIGSRPSGRINPRAIEFMNEKGIDLAVQSSKGLDDLPRVEWDYIVTMGCGDACPSLPAAHRLDWELPDPKHLSDDGFRAVRDRIEGLINGLLAQAGVPAAHDAESRS